MVVEAALAWKLPQEPRERMAAGTMPREQRVAPGRGFCVPGEGRGVERESWALAGQLGCGAVLSWGPGREQAWDVGLWAGRWHLPGRPRLPRCFVKDYTSQEPQPSGALPAS